MKISNGVDELIRELKSQGVLRSSHVEAAFRKIDRKDFVPLETTNEAYGNYPIPIGYAQTISQPYTVAFMLDLLDPKPGERILDIGAGSGWQTALLAEIVSRQQETARLPDGQGNRNKEGKIVATERIPGLCSFAQKNIEKYSFMKWGIVELRCEDASAEAVRKPQFDGIIAAAASPGSIPKIWRDQVRVGGRIVAPVDGSIWRFTKISNNTWNEEEFPGFAFVPLIQNRHQETENSPPAGRLEKQEPHTELRRKNYITYFIVSFLLLASCYFAYATFVPKNIERTEIEIASGMGSRAIGSLLKSKQLIRSKWIFVSYTAIADSASRLKPGTYEFEGVISIPRIVRELVAGDSDERTITIPEGWDLADLATYFESIGMYSAEDLFLTAGRPPSVSKSAPPPSFTDLSETFSFLRELPRGATLEGFLFPDTYRIYRNASITDAISKMLANFDKKISPELREEIYETRRTLFEIIIMASLVEKEVANDSERKIVAGILWKRLDLGIPLQVDATVNYVMGKKGSPNASDLAVKSPYNTYQNRGLPPGPIANPGLNAIAAAIHPTKNPYLYYLSTPEGTTIFSKSLEEHNIAKGRYLGR